eukprot:CAMPEP_0182834176 /NCGR_PEP_ID=MMETSP0006_2-20121128/20765_1 /TAXON_ID=97485 /ORGANISM="Prymnesium parvum, Strain Texoma1" /LENGTH=109 /DNA_ID=CAMNT_0024962385 /DNA_START=92 /DNA_END=422 /DNA_ORIENTATION=-
MACKESWFHIRQKKFRLHHSRLCSWEQLRALGSVAEAESAFPLCAHMSGLYADRTVPSLHPFTLSKGKRGEGAESTELPADEALSSTDHHEMPLQRLQGASSESPAGGE